MYIARYPSAACMRTDDITYVFEYIVAAMRPLRLLPIGCDNKFQIKAVWDCSPKVMGVEQSHRAF